MYHVNATISGNVQGVGFRYATKKTANSLGIKGYVKNLPDGSVYVEAEGNEKNLNQFIRWLHEGPSHARVQKVETEDDALANYNHFEIK